MKKIILAGSCMLFSLLLHAQTESFDIATFKRPQGWERIDSNGVTVIHDLKTNNGLTSFCQIFLYPSQRTSGNAAKDFSKAWSDYVVKATKTKLKPKTATEKNPDGWTIVIGSTNVTLNQMTFACMLVTASGFGKTMSTMVNVAGKEYATVIDSFFNNFDLDKNATVSKEKTNTNMNTLIATLDSYQYIPPEGWQAQKGNGFVLLTQPSTSGLACQLTIISPVPFSGNLENETKNVFSQMYPGWRFYYSDARHDDLMKGNTKQGFGYCMMEAPMVRTRPDGNSWDYETGSALLVNLGTHVAIITLRHESTGIHCQCKQRYDYWGRFFNSFTIKNFSVPIMGTDVHKRIIGSWTASGNRAIGEYIFAANGRYQYIGGFGNFTQISPELLELKTSAFQGDGNYKLENDQLVMTRKGNSTPEIYKFRLEKINKGSTGWKDRIILLDENPADKGPAYEAIYERIVR